MAWTTITAGQPELVFRDDGVLEWNTAMHILLSTPEWVDLMWEPTLRQLGVRCNFIAMGFPVYAEPENGEFRIDSAVALAAAGIGVASTISGVPESWQGGEHGLEDWSGLERVYYLTLP